MVVRVRVIEDDVDDEPAAAQPRLKPARIPRPLSTVRRNRKLALVDGTIVAVVALAASIAFNTRASLWFDETATAVATNRSYAQLFQMVQSVDVVHVAYYALLHPWIAIAGVSAETLRLPSAVFTAAGAVGMLALGRALGQSSGIRAARRLGLTAAFLYLALPAVSWAATEARSAALVTALIIWTTVALVRAQRSSGAQARRWWIVYAVLAALSVGVFLYAGLVLVAHGLTLMVSRRGRSVREGWFVSAGVVALASVPLVLVAQAEQAQVAWIPKLSLDTFSQVFVLQWFRFAPAFAALAWGAIVVLIAVTIRRRQVSRRDGWARGTKGGWVRPMSPVVLGVCWLVLPTAVLLIVSVAGAPMYLPRYLMTSAPAVSLLLAVAVTFARPQLLSALLLVALVGLGAQDWWAERAPRAKEGFTYSAVANILRSQGQAGDAIVYERDGPGGAWSSRTVAYGYPDAVRKLDDITLATPAADSGTLWETSVPVANRLTRLNGVDRVWYLKNENGTDGMLQGGAVQLPTTDGDWKALVAAGYHDTSSWQLGPEHLYLLTRAAH